MPENKQQILKDNTSLEKPAIEIKSVQELKGLDFIASDGFVCDMETGVCGPVNQEKETKS